MKPRQEGPARGRRRFLKGLVGVPALAAFGGGIACTREVTGPRAIRPADADAIAPPLPSVAGGTVRVGFIGVGRRGGALLEQCLQRDLNVAITGICDVFDVHADAALATARRGGHRPRRFRTYHELVQSAEVDAVVIATPDHWHAPMALAAVEASKHVYVEHTLGYRLGDIMALRRAVLRAPVVLQVGHQYRQTSHFFAARAALRSDVLGHVRLAEVNTRLPAGQGSWQAPLHEQASPRTIDWRQFLGSAPPVQFDPERFFRWRKWWDYGTGLAGETLAEDFDRLNGVLDLGIPAAVVASGGIYAYNDGREVPDVLHVGLEFPEYRVASGGDQGTALVYTATLGPDYARHAALTGREARLRWDSRLTLESAPAAQAVRRERVLYAPHATLASSVAVAGPAESPTWRHGHLYDATYLHLRDWLGCVRHGGTPACGIEQGFEEAVTVHMATLAYRLGRRVEWDRQALRLRNVTRQELENLNMA
jgi:predicted dehydrogenase